MHDLTICSPFRIASELRALYSRVAEPSPTAGLSYSTVRGMVQAHVNAVSISLAKWAPRLRFQQDFEALFGAVASGSLARVGGRRVDGLDLKGCNHLTDADVSMMIAMFGRLR